MKKLIALTLAIFSLHVFAKWEDCTLKKYPDADQVIVDEVVYTEYTPEGTFFTEDEQWVKILTEKGRRDASSMTISYNLRYGKAEFLLIELIGEDGAVRPIDFASTLSESTDNSSMKENIFDPMDKNLTCAIPGVKVGDVLHMKFRKVVDKARFENQWSNIEVFEYGAPIEHTLVTIKAPAELPLKTKRIVNPLGNVTEKEETLADGSTFHTWEVKDSPQAFDEPDMPPMYTQVQHLRVSTTTDWKELSKWYWNLCAPHLNKITPEIEAKVEEVGHDINKLYKWVAQEIRYMGLTMEDTSPGYAPHDIDITFNNRYGVCRDKAALLVAMLRKAGFNAFPVLINAGAKLNLEVPQPFFNHAIVAVDQGGEYILMDPTDESSRDLMPAYLSDCNYLVCRPEGETLLLTPTVPVEKNSLEVVSKGSFNADGSILLDNRIVCRGINDNAFRGTFLRMKADERQRRFERILRRVSPGAEVISLEILPKDLRDTSKELTFHILSHLPEMTIEGETMCELKLPLISKEMGVANWLLDGKTSLDKRRYPLTIAATAGVSEELELTLGDKLGKAIKLPKEIDVKGAYSLKTKVEAEAGVLKATRSLAINKVEFSPEEYLEIKAALKAAEALERERPLFAVDKLKGADVHYLKKLCSVRELKGVNSWVITNTVEKKILTYDGKKKNAEIILDYNPSWEEIEFLDCTVTGPDGKVARLTEKEKNLLDAEWVGEAPRYPASKKLVVNLPSVEIGSVISYTYVHKVTNSFAPFFTCFFHDVIEPTDYLEFDEGDKLTAIANPKLLERESMQPSARLWRDYHICQFGIFDKVDLKLKPFVFEEAGKTVEEIRNWMAKHVRVAGPSLYEIRLEDQLTEPETIIKERYANELDYVRTLAALLQGAGYEAKIVFASFDKFDNSKIKAEDEFHCLMKKFSNPLVMVDGMFLGLENEYMPLGVSVYDGSSYYDPVDAIFGKVLGKSDRMPFARASRLHFDVDEKGAVDVEVSQRLSGHAVGGFAKKYAEMLPEERARHFLDLVSTLGEGAEATSELSTKVEDGAALLEFSAHIDDFATVSDDLITISVPEFFTPLFAATGSKRSTALGIGAKRENSVAVATVRFPKGYTLVEHLPESYVIQDPFSENQWYKFIVTTYEEEGSLYVDLCRHTYEREESMLGKEYFPLLKEWSKLGSSEANRTISVRRK